MIKLVAGSSRHLGAFLLYNGLTLLFLLVLGDRTWHLLAILPGNLAARFSWHLALMLILNSLARLLGNLFANISSDIVTFLLRDSVFDLLLVGTTLLPSYSLTFLLGYLFALLSGDLVAYLAR